MVEKVNDIRLFPSLLAWSAVPWTVSEAELKVLWAVSETELAAFLVTRVSKEWVTKMALLCLSLLESVGHCE